jgi:hypothetical protein
LANIAITAACNLNCRYCFAQPEFSAYGEDARHMPMSLFRKALDFVRRSNIAQIRILGGEPTLHPQFMDFMESAQATGLPVRLFSNGAVPDEALEYLSRTVKERVTLIVNVTRLSDPKNPDSPVLENTLARLGDKVIPGFNISDERQELRPLFDLISRHGLQNRIRLGMTHPCMGASNEHLPSRSLMKTGRMVAEFAKHAAQKRIQINLDCGFVPCLFPGVHLSELGLLADMGTHCQPILDILPDGRAIACYALSHWGRMDLNDATADALREAFSRSLSAFRPVGIFKACSGCDYQSRDLCAGGSVCRKISRLSPVPPNRRDG